MVCTARKKIQKVEITTSTSVDFLYRLFQKIHQRLPWQRPFWGKKYVFWWQNFKKSYLRTHVKYLGAVNGKPILRYPGSFLVTFVYNTLRQNGQFWDKNISFELRFLGKWQKSMILRLP